MVDVGMRSSSVLALICFRKLKPSGLTDCVTSCCLRAYERLSGEILMAARTSSSSQKCYYPLSRHIRLACVLRLPLPARSFIDEGKHSRLRRETNCTQHKLSFAPPARAQSLENMRASSRRFGRGIAQSMHKYPTAFCRMASALNFRHLLTSRRVIHRGDRGACDFLPPSRCQQRYHLLRTSGSLWAQAVKGFQAAGILQRILRYDLAILPVANSILNFQFYGLSKMTRG